MDGLELPLAEVERTRIEPGVGVGPIAGVERLVDHDGRDLAGEVGGARPPQLPRRAGRDVVRQVLDLLETRSLVPAEMDPGAERLPQPDSERVRVAVDVRHEDIGDLARRPTDRRRSRGRTR
jgi:hypothetical protein